MLIVDNQDRSWIYLFGMRHDRLLSFLSGSANASFKVFVQSVPITPHKKGMTISSLEVWGSVIEVGEAPMKVWFFAANRLRCRRGGSGTGTGRPSAGPSRAARGGPYGRGTGSGTGDSLRPPFRPARAVPAADCGASLKAAFFRFIDRSKQTDIAIGIALSPWNESHHVQRAASWVSFRLFPGGLDDIVLLTGELFLAPFD